MILGLVTLATPSSARETVKGVICPAPERAEPSLESDRPIVRVVSPMNGSAIVMQDGERKLLIVLEIVDLAGSGIESDDSGTPRFVDPNPNVKIFLSYRIGEYRYVDSNNQSVIQMVSEVPVAKLVAEKGWRITAPVDWKKVSPAWRKHGIEFPPGPTIEYAAFFFHVRDKRGIASEEKKVDPKQDFIFPDLMVGFASSAYVPEGEPPPDQKRSDESSSGKAEEKN
jgi:hypothetical protein